MPPRRRLRSGSSQQDHDTTTVSALPNELLVRVMSAVARQPSFRGLCRVECVSRAWRDLAKARESELWQHVLTQRWSKQPALDVLGVGPRRQVMLLAADGTAAADLPAPCGTSTGSMRAQGGINMGPF